MAFIKWAQGIEFVSGLLSKRPKAGTMHSDHANALLATHRVAETTNPKCTRIYMVGEYNRSTQPDTDELARRERFAAVAAAVATRKKDLSKITTDQQNFLAQKDQPNGKKTMKSYLWSLELASYDQAHS
ncbi:MAG: hypothetical protein J5761_02420 [Paludibacteraceae bacterium]|nr:hypothetical protein [Paludibacteraceae bacterium]